MKKHFISLFDNTHIKRTIYLFVIAALLIVASLLIGINDNPPVIAMLFIGIIFLFFSVLHPWGKAINYGILTLVCFCILFLEWIGIHILVKIHKTEFISEGIAMSLALFICLPGILAGIIGSLICTFRKK
jgi:hypothetical protein